jgi:plasmid stabilization system protein ParE
MTYRVVLQRLAVEDLQAAYDWLKPRAPESAARWLARFEQALQSLDTIPERCAIASENTKVDVELREMHFGKRPYVFRAIFTVDGNTVRVLRIRRAQRRFLNRAEIKQALD